jgi:hypothetical protein
MFFPTPKVTIESRRAGFDGVEGLAKPKMPQREGLVARELPFEVAVCDRSP